MRRGLSIADDAGFIGVMFYCPGCKWYHAVYVTRPNSIGAQWTFNGDYEKPTFTPSILVFTTMPDESRRTECHSFVTNGQIQFLGDCRHEMKSQTVDLPELRSDDGSPVSWPPTISENDNHLAV